MNIDRFLIAGRVTMPVRMRETSQGVPCCTIPVAVNRRFRRNDGSTIEKTVFFDIQAYAGAAIAAGKRLNVGDDVVVEGRHENRTLTTDAGHQVTVLETVAEYIHFGRSRNEPEPESESIS